MVQHTWNSNYSLDCDARKKSFASLKFASVEFHPRMSRDRQKAYHPQLSGWLTKAAVVVDNVAAAVVVVVVVVVDGGIAVELFLEQ